MATTVASDLIVPEVWGNAIMTTVPGKSVLQGLSSVDDELVGEPGDTVHFPKWDYIGDAEDLTEGVAMDTEKMSMSDSAATIKEAGKAVELTDRAVLTAIDDPDDQARGQLALSIARKIDTDLRAAALYEHTNAGGGDPIPTTAPLKFDGGTNFGWSDYVAAIALLGDEYEPSDIRGIVVSSAQHASLLNDDNFKSSLTAPGGEGVLTRGRVGFLGSVPVILSDRGSASGAQKALIIRQGALALKYKRRAIVESDRDILKRTNVITTNAHYATKRTDDRGIIVVTTTEA
jgi:N4-gp56 family major capsid protein